MTPKIDAHQHFWKYDPAEYEWIDDSMAAIQCNFAPEDLRAELAAAGIDGSIAVQARQTTAETHWLLDLAEEHRFLRGVVGWAPIAHPSFPRLLEELSENPLLKGLRHVVQAEPEGFLEGHDFNAGISALLPSGLVYDILIVERQLDEAIAFVDRHPKQIFVLDHLAKPRIAAGEIARWAANVAELAKRQNVYCKLSGMVTEADWRSWTPASLQPYVDVALESFGPQRLMAGSDWPVCTVVCSYARWNETLEGMLALLSPEEQARIFGGTAVEAYRLHDRSPA